MIKLKHLFEDPVLLNEVTVTQRRKKIGNKFYNLFFIRKKDGELLGRELGYDSKEEAVRDLLSIKSPAFMRRSTIKQKESIDRYIKKNKL